MGIMRARARIDSQINRDIRGIDFQLALSKLSLILNCCSVLRYAKQFTVNLSRDRVNRVRPRVERHQL